MMKNEYPARRILDLK